MKKSLIGMLLVLCLLLCSCSSGSPTKAAGSFLNILMDLPNAVCRSMTSIR